MDYTLFNQRGQALMSSSSIAELMNYASDGGYRYWFITGTDNVVLVDKMGGRKLPRRTSHGTVTRSERGN